MRKSKLIVIETIGAFVYSLIIVPLEYFGLGMNTSQLLMYILLAIPVNFLFGAPYIAFMQRWLRLFKEVV